MGEETGLYNSSTGKINIYLTSKYETSESSATLESSSEKNFLK